VFTVGDIGEHSFSLTRAPTTDEEEGVARAGERTQLVGMRPSEAATGQHTEAADRRRAGDAFMLTLELGRRIDEDHIEGVRSWQATLNEHYANRRER
jgi:hypothetical protein